MKQRFKHKQMPIKQSSSIHRDNIMGEEFFIDCVWGLWLIFFHIGLPMENKRYGRETQFARAPSAPQIQNMIFRKQTIRTDYNLILLFNLILMLNINSQDYSSHNNVSQNMTIAIRHRPSIFVWPSNHSCFKQDENS